MRPLPAMPTGAVKCPARLPLEALVEQARAQRRPAAPLDLAAAIDRGRYYVCPTITPLYHTDTYRFLTGAQARRYNQLCAMSFNEVILFFEREIGFRILPALGRLEGAPPALREYLGIFAEEEAGHLEMWQALNRLSEPGWYRAGEHRFVRLPAPLRWTLEWSSRHPGWFPFYLWIMLAQEERAIDVARRSLRLDADRLEPRYAEAYRLHLLDEVRHVQIDWYLIESFYAPRSAAVRRWNAGLLRILLRGLLLSPSRVGVGMRVVRQLAAEFPDLQPLLPGITRELRALASNRDYQEMMYSRRSHPITFSLFDRHPELHRMERTLAGYRPAAAGGAA